jgi:hypothetical protein
MASLELANDYIVVLVESNTGIAYYITPLLPLVSRIATSYYSRISYPKLASSQLSYAL